MIKRLMIFIVLAGAVTAGSAHAGCPGASAGHRGGATVDAVEVDGTRTVTVTIDARYLDACDDGSVQFSEGVILGAPTTLTITGDDACTAETTSDWDPFGFAVGMHDTGKDPEDPESPHVNTTCNIDITWSGFLSPYLPDAERSGLVEDGVRILVSKVTNHEDGVVFVNGVEYRAHGQNIGVMWTGVGGDQ